MAAILLPSPGDALNASQCGRLALGLEYLLCQNVFAFLSKALPTGACSPVVS